MNVTEIPGKLANGEMELTQKSLEEARKEVMARVRNSAGGIADGLIKVAQQGRLAEAKYLFEIAGVYPVVEETAGEDEESLAHCLLKSLGLPTDGLDRDEE